LFAHQFIYLFVYLFVCLWLVLGAAEGTQALGWITGPALGAGLYELVSFIEKKSKTVKAA